MPPKKRPLPPTESTSLASFGFLTKKQKTAFDNQNAPASMTASTNLAATEDAVFATGPDAVECGTTSTHVESSEAERYEEAGGTATEGPPLNWGHNQWRSWKERNPWLFSK